MEKTDCVLIVSDKEILGTIAQTLNYDKVNLVRIFLDGYGKKSFRMDDKDVDVSPFSEVYSRAAKYKNSTWLIGSFENRVGSIKKFLVTLGIDENKIFAFDLFGKISPTWIANYHHIERYGADFFVTGNELECTGINTSFIPCTQKDKSLALGGVNLADVNQDLQTSYFIAKNVFSHVKPCTIKFVLIGLSPDIFHQDYVGDFFNLEYLFFLKMLATKITTTEQAQADLNFDRIRKPFYREFSQEAVTDWQDPPKYFSKNAVEKNVQILKDYINLCVAHNAKPVGFVLPPAPILRNNYDKKILADFREIIHKLEESTPFICVNMFSADIDYDCFADMTHLNFAGSERTNSMLSLRLYQNGCIPLESFLDRVYTYFDRMSRIASKEDFNSLMQSIFELSTKKIGQKKKIKVAFILYLAEFWYGDDLYNIFDNDERFEVTVFFGWAAVLNGKKEDIKKDLLGDFEKFKARGLNVVLMDNSDMKVPTQDIIFHLTPYTQHFPKTFWLSRTKLSSLIIMIPYGMYFMNRGNEWYNQPIFRTVYKVFAASNIEKKQYQERCETGLPNMIYCGYPKLDSFLHQDDLNFEWKMAQPDAKKIIYAPHWSKLSFSTFRFNYQFMYKYAKAHPEISWVIKPHPNLRVTVSELGVFSTVEEVAEYLKKWDELPNAKLYTGANYQSIFATSDGMIHDSGSFMIEYQYTHKPMIYLLNPESKVTVNELATGVLNVSYLVDGNDLKGIVEMFQRIFIEGDDYKADERKKFFDENLNYFKQNGMSASEYIYKTICKDLGVDAK